jgi:hypothetical protein
MDSHTGLDDVGEFCASTLPGVFCDDGVFCTLPALLSEEFPEDSGPEPELRGPPPLPTLGESE